MRLTKWLSRVIMLMEVFRVTSIEMSARISALEEELARLPMGNLAMKKIKGKEQPYLQWSDGGKTKSRYIKLDEREITMKQLERRKEIQQELRKLRKEAGVSSVKAEAPVYHTRVVSGVELDHMISSVEGLQKRDCFTSLQKYMQGNTPGKVCLLYGLRRTGKTTLLLQTIAEMMPEDRTKAVYIKARVTDTMADMNRDLKLLDNQGYRYFFIDEVTLMEDFIDSASLFSDVYAMMGRKIVLSGTDSLGFWFTLNQELYDRAYTLHTTYIPFREYSRLLGIDDIDEYIRYGGTLRAGELAFDDEDALEADAAFRDDESTRRYIDTAICKNIQHSLVCCDRGNYFRHLRILYEAGELTGAINRIIESMNHQFLLWTLIQRFKSHDLGSAAEVLRKQPDPEKRTDILDQIDRDAVTKKLMEMLEIRNQEDQKVGITQAHVEEIKEYLKALDLVVDCPVETTVVDAEPTEYVLFTQPGMRYCQAQALVHILMKDPLFQSFSEREKQLAADKILEEVRGRMLEDIVLLETSRVLRKGDRAFKLVLSRSEFDMFIYHAGNNTSEAYEIKHSREIVERQYHVLKDDELCAEAERKYGAITTKCILYRGADQDLPNGIVYRNVEKWLKQR